MEIRIAILSLTLPVVWACTSPGHQQQERPEKVEAPATRPRRGPVRHRIQVGEHVARVRLAATAKDRLQGLQGVPKLAEDEGMLFVYPANRESLGFWMKGCVLALDIAFLDTEGKVINVVTLQPPGPDVPDDELPRARAAGPCRMVLEMNAGWFEKRKLGAGARVSIPTALLAKKSAPAQPIPRR